ncbi:peptidoglycan/LPS O-acetylase OafA/YrhL [Streptomyces sp. KhCrAH-43]|uniref:acyltransferase family protein n=1 Tax=unclassified Streptomyces TaxID=2593676 RepID=UPI000DC3EE40|nr:MULTISPECIES: acyltransferase [unclassified Streptomyces]RAJ57888.1 peptidoglycan/LPS O-acetylase OafA/YrhL [Streptomyces sp. KhCrAH-43]
MTDRVMQEPTLLLPPAQETGRRRGARSTSGRGRLAAVDGLRLLAAGAVAAYHYLGTPTPHFWGEDHDLAQVAPLLHAVSGYGWLGVEAFFLVSGFVICMSCWDRTPAQFAVSRFARLFPLYWSVVLIIVATGGVTVLAGQRSGAPTDLRTTLGNLTMIPGPLGLDFTDGVAWTLWVEARFYLLMGALLLFGLTYRRVVAFGFLWLILASIGRDLHSAALNEVLLSQYAGLFVTGIALYLIHRFGPDLLLGLLAGFAWCYTLTVLDDRIASHADSDWATGAAVLTGFLVLLALAGTGPLRHVQWPVLVHAGALTYPFYLVHQSLGIPVARGILKAAPGLGLLTSIALGLLASLLLAAALNGLIDQRLAPKFRRGLSAALDPTRTQQRPAQELPERRGLPGAAKPRSAPYGQA